MEPILTRCGYRCDLCLAYRSHATGNPGNRQILSDSWYRYFGLRLPPSAICCDGCMAENPHLDQDCPVRPCVMQRGIDHCAQCEQCVCEKLAERLVVYEEVKHRVGGEIPEEDTLRFIRPYENKKRLDALKSAHPCEP